MRASICIGLRRWWLGALCLVAGGTTAAAERPLSFDRDVRPILADACFACHGPDARTRKADLRLDRETDATGGDEPVIVRGKPDDSELYRRITASDPDAVMPPPDAKKTLTAAQKEIVRQWIAQGAKYEGHWSFQPIRRPELPPTSEPVRNPIDAFLNARLEAEGLPIGGEASRETLIRRVAFALTGLPPTVAEVDQYLADTAPGAYERMVDRYLASPRYGEEMARHWLDVARYADTHGLHLDNERQMWAYRDWVVRAFNRNLPFDQFTIWQVAGDLLPNATTDQQIATGFIRCNVTTSEGGAIADEFTYRYAVERTSATAQAWLGLTAGCAVCHDHKYDPLTTKEFYSLYAFFNSAADPAMDGNSSTTPPFIKLPSPEQQATADAAGRAEREARAWLDTVAGFTPYTDPGPTATARSVRTVLFDDVFPVGTTSRSSSRNAVAWVVDPDFGAASGRRAIRQAFASKFTDTVEFKLRPIVMPQEGAVEVRLRVEPRDVPQSVTFGVSGGKSVTWSRTAAGLVREGRKDAEIVPGRWTTLTIAAADLGLKPGSRLASVQLGQHGGIAYWDALAVVGSSPAAADPLASFAAWRKAIGTMPPPDVPGELHAAIQAGPDKPLGPDDAARLQRFYLAVVARPVTEELAAARSAWEAARAARLIAEESAPGTFIFRDLGAPRQSFVMRRGQYDQPGDKVEPAGPAFLPPIRPQGDTARLTRLDLARWLVAPENPLTARVAANRLWQQFFGTGLVKTSSDFGTQGERPSHPELLDWLAAELGQGSRVKGQGPEESRVKSQGSRAKPLPPALDPRPLTLDPPPAWDIKRFVRLLVTSEAFRRDSRIAPEVQTRDPQNRLYARGPRFRLDAEPIRDNALFVSGLMDFTMGGHGVRPYQPPNIWEPVGYSDSNTRFYMQDHGSALYRRSLYVFLKRTAPPPFMSNFDAPNREQVCTARERSNTPLQALQLMNDVQHFEAARALAERALAQAGPTDADRITFLYRTVLSRPPDAEERQLVASALATQRTLFRADPDAATKAIHVGESQPRLIAPADETAAWTMIANLLLNLDETLCRN